MKKKLLSGFLAGFMTLSLLACGSTPAEPDSGSTKDVVSESVKDDKNETTSDTIELTMWGAEEDQDLLKKLADDFIALHSGEATITINIGVESESTAKDTVLADPEAAADVFAFADDQLKALVDGHAVQAIDEVADALQVAGTTLDAVKAANSSGSVNAATYDGKLYGFPMSGGNGFFLYYDSNVLSSEDVKTWDSLLAAAGAANSKVGMTLNSGWYNAGFFVGAGFSAGSVDANGTTSIDWNGTSSKGITGVQVVQAMLNIAGNSAFQAIPDGEISGQIAAGGLCAVVSGTWDASAAEAAFGDGYEATVLPTFTAGGQVCQQADYAGFKIVGVNPYSKNVGWAALLAEYITNEASQSARFEARQSLPTNIVAASVPEIAENKALAAIMAQDAYGVPQTVGGNFWEPTKTFGENIAQGTWAADDEATIQSALDTMVEGVTAPIG